MPKQLPIKDHIKSISITTEKKKDEKTRKD